MRTTPDHPSIGAFWEAAGLWLLIILSGILFVACLLLHVQSQEEEAIQRSRILLTLTQLRESIESEMALGFDLPDNTRIQPLIDRALEGDHQIHAIDVVDVSGMALFSTDRGVVGEGWQPQVGEAAQAGLRADRDWAASLAGGEAVIGIPLHSAFGEAVGQISVTYAVQSHARALAGAGAPVLAVLSNSMVQVTAGLLVVVALIGWMGAWWAQRPQQRLLKEERGGRLARVKSRYMTVRHRLDICLDKLDESEHAQ